MWKYVGRAACRWGLLTLLAVLLSSGVLASTCGGGKFEELGTKLGEEVAEGTIPASYMYVADAQRKLYWPNTMKYVDQIPKEYRVYILDAETLAEFKGYKPGKL